MGVRRKVGSTKKIPGNWEDFLKEPANKRELFEHLTDICCQADYTDDKEVVLTTGQKFVSYQKQRSYGRNRSRRGRH